MSTTDSPLRYPGGKTKLYSLVQPIVLQNIVGDDKTYIEPFAGGSGLALKLLLQKDVDRLVLNDIDYHVYTFWNICLHRAEELCERIQSCEINMDTWNRQREIYNNTSAHDEFEVAFSTFFLNRCNVSGILRGGPIGGHQQQRKDRLDARFNRSALIKKIEKIYEKREQIDFYNQDAKAFLLETLPQYNKNDSLLNIDPPYVKKGPMLYENSFSQDDHRALSVVITNLTNKWIVTYDECKFVYDLYSRFRKEIVTLHYSAGQSKSGKELIIYSDNLSLDI